MDRHYYCIKDNLGSTVAVVDGDGVTRQLTAYYPSGVPYDLTAARATDRLHIAGRWLDHQGMNTYDNTARMYRPKGRFFWFVKSLCCRWYYLKL